MDRWAERHRRRDPRSELVTRYIFFFFQAEDGIRDYKVTGVQTCALPIFGLDRVGAGKNKEIRIHASGTSSLDLVDHVFALDYFLAAHVSAFFGRDLILDRKSVV